VDRPIAGAEPRPAPDSLAEPLHRATWVGVDREKAGRVASLRFDQAEARHKAPRLVVELIPRFANVILVGNDDRILWAQREFQGDHSRRIVAGRPYEAPGADPGLPLSGLDATALRERLEAGDGPLHRRIPRGWGGGAVGFARLLEQDAAGPEEFVERLLRVAAATGEDRPCLARDDGGQELPVLFPADPGPLPGWTIRTEDTANALADAYYRPREEGQAADTLLADLRRVLVKRRNRAAKALRQIERRLEEAGREGELREQAELLAANVSTLRRGMKSARLSAFDGSGEVEIALDPKLDPSGNVEALFKKARRIARGRLELESQQSIQGAELEDVDAALSRLEDAAPEQLADVAREHAPSLLDRRPGTAVPVRSPLRTPDAQRGSAPEGFQPRIYFLPGHWEVWVGRNAKQNDELTHQRASQRDLWFHARGCQGSHTVLRVSSGKGEPPRDIVLATASIAAFHSKARNSQLVPVAYTEKRYVRRPRGAKPGTAVMMREKVVMVEPRLPEGAEE
jgi:predicted ribosome quality control (RQC) complex YloA/Tae2 family protein